MMAHQSDLRNVCLVIPTYNEADNIAQLIASIRAQTTDDRALREIHILVVDDSSPDGTARIVEGIMENDPHVHLLSRTEKKGLGAAYSAGMQHAMRTLGADVVFEMDADFSHDPAYILDMIEALEGADLVIGSRWTEGGGVDEDWPVQRVFASRLANEFTRLMLSIKTVDDVTGGFRAIRTSMLSKVDLASLESEGYSFQIELLVRLINKGARVREIPIIFHNRRAGESKLAAGDVIEGFSRVIGLRGKLT